MDPKRSRDFPTDNDPSLEVQRADATLGANEKTPRVVIEDLTELKNAEAALRQSEEKYEKAFAFSSSPSMISEISEGRLVDVNAAFTEFTGFTRDEAIGKSAVDLGLIGAELREEIRKQIGEDGRIDHLEMEADTKSGSRTVLLSACVVDLESGPHFFTSVADITARKRARTAVEARLAFEETVSSVARALAELSWDHLHLGFDKALKQIGQYLGVAVCGLSQISTDREVCRVTNVWRAQGIDDEPDRWNENLFDLFPYQTAQILGGDDFIVHDPFEIPVEGGKEREFLERAGIKSTAHVPLSIEGEVVGDLWVETTREARRWDPETLQPLRVFGTILANALRRQRAEESARKAWEFTETALDSQMDTFFVFDLNSGEAVRWNRAFQELTGYSDDEIARLKAPDSWYDEGDLAKAEQTVEEVLKEGVGTVELSLITKDGTRIPTEYRVSALTDEAGEATHLISVGRDVTDRKLTEEALRRNKERLNAIIDNIPAMTYTGSMKGRVSFISENVRELTGYTSQELYEADPGFFLRRIHPDDREAMKGALGDLAAEGIPLDLEFRFRKKDGEWIWVHDQAAVTFEEDGVQCHYGMAFDVTERREAEEALRRSEERYHALIENIPGVTWVSERGGRTAFISPNVEEIYGYSPREIYEGGAEIWFGRIHPDDREAVEVGFDRLMRLRKPLDIEYRIQRKDGQWIWLNDRAATRFEEGDTTYAYGVFTDITEKKRLENQVVEISDWERQRMGQELHDDLGQQLTGLSALTSSLRARLASEGRPETKDAARIEEIAKGAVLHTRNLARGLYPHDVTGKSLPEAIRSLGKTAEALFGISCPVRVEGKFREIQEEEALHLFRICQESINNAMKHGGAKTVSVSLEMGQSSLSLGIEDDGRGFGLESVQEGMGLSVMRCRADLLGGSLEVKSSPGEGTTIALNMA